MSQSNRNTTPEPPKSTADAHRSQTTESTSEVRPACHAGDVDGRDWRTGSLVSFEGFFEPCQWPECYPDGAPDAAKTVVLSRRDPTVFHRPRPQTVERDSPTSENEDTDVERRPTSRFTQSAINTRASLTEVTELQEYDGVIWESHQTPLAVVGPTDDLDGAVDLAGPSGGAYTLERRSEPEYAIYPGYGRVSGVDRIESSQNREEDPDDA